jgi:hypothetical protein
MKHNSPREESQAEKQPTARSPQDERKEARDQLTLVLGFFPRVDAKASAILAINTAMLAVLASNAPAAESMSVFSRILAGLTGAMIGGSFWFLYRVAFPVIHGGHQSLVYFREIAKRTEAAFIDDFLGQTDAARIKDLLGQVWRNSEILKLKFDSLRWAFVLMALAIIPWATAVLLFSSQHLGVHGFITR